MCCWMSWAWQGWLGPSCSTASPTGSLLNTPRLVLLCDGPYVPCYYFIALCDVSGCSSIVFWCSLLFLYCVIWCSLLFLYCATLCPLVFLYCVSWSPMLFLYCVTWCPLLFIYCVTWCALLFLYCVTWCPLLFLYCVTWCALLFIYVKLKFVVRY